RKEIFQLRYLRRVSESPRGCLAEAPQLSRTLALKGFVSTRLEDYQPVLDYQRSAHELGYPTLA
ncbi:MAG: hypothetical protein NTV76_00990, partial [Pseudomonas sp.]|nr:hypothetical protein [Pseudomonas sp.]